MNKEDLLPSLLLPVSQSLHQSLCSANVVSAGSIDNDCRSISLAADNISRESEPTIMLTSCPTNSFGVVKVTEEDRFDASSLQVGSLLFPSDERGDLQLLDCVVLGTEETGEDGSSTAF